VVAGASRTLDPHMNLWHDARPVVEDYIKDSIGPKALVRDLIQTARILSRFGPRLPEMAEAALIRTTNPAPKPQPQRLAGRLGWFGAGIAVTFLAIWLTGWV